MKMDAAFISKLWYRATKMWGFTFEKTEILIVTTSVPQIILFFIIMFADSL